MIDHPKIDQLGTDEKVEVAGLLIDQLAEVQLGVLVQIGSKIAENANIQPIGRGRRGHQRNRAKESIGEARDLVG